LNSPQLASLPLKKIEKYYVLNRIVSPDLAQNVKSVLNSYGVAEDHVLEIPFEWEEYALRDFRWDGGVADATGVWSIGRAPRSVSESRRGEVVDHVLQAIQMTNQTYQASEFWKLLSIKMELTGCCSKSRSN